MKQGPPGTGKTHTIQGILSAIIQKENNKPFVLVCAPSNSAVDEIANRVALDGLYDIDGSQKIYTSILRIGNKFTKNFQDIREKLKKDLRESPPAVKEIMLSTKVAALLKNEGTENGNIEIDKLLKDLENIDKSLLAARQKKKPNSLIISLEEKRTQTSNALFRMRNRFIKYFKYYFYYLKFSWFKRGITNFSWFWIHNYWWSLSSSRA